MVRCGGGWWRRTLAFGGRWQPPIMWCSYHEQPGETKWKPPSAAAASVLHAMLARCDEIAIAESFSLIAL